MKTVSCVSDLHLFCRRSRADSYLDEIEKAAAESDIFILNGDTFDFRWSIHSSIAETVEASIRWLRNLVEQAPDCQFYFILGNHDNVQLFMEALDVLAQSLPNLEWHAYYVKLDRHLFLHGDCSNRNMTAADLREYREGWLHEEQKGELMNRVYDVAFRLGVHKLVNRWAFPTDRIISRIQYYLDDIGEGKGSDTEHVFFGHTHVVLKGIEVDGQRFTNGGAPMEGIHFEVLRTEIPQEHTVRGE